MYCTQCLKPCDAITAVVAVVGKIEERRGYYSEDVYGEVSDCCEAELSAHYPGPICCVCDESATVRCTGCGEFICAECFGRSHAEAGGPCPWCAVNLARQGIY